MSKSSNGEIDDAVRAVTQKILHFDVIFHETRMEVMDLRKLLMTGIVPVGDKFN